MSVVCREVEFLRRADHSSRGVLPTVVRRFVWSRDLVNEEVLAHWGTVAPKTNKPTSKYLKYEGTYNFVGKIKV